MILVLSGTSDGRALAVAIQAAGFSVKATATTEYGGDLIKAEALEVLVGKLDVDDMVALIKGERVSALVDATHPYAANASDNAIQACLHTGIRYIRYERKASEIEDVKTFDTHEDVIAYLNANSGQVFLTIGSNFVGKYADGVEKERLITRVLPTSKVIKKCEDAGLKPNQIIGMQGPFSKDMNIEMFSHYKAKFIVTKESADVGGVMEKVEAAQAVGADLLLVKRPGIDYPEVYQTFDDILNALKVRSS